MRVGSVKWRGSDPESGVVDDTATEVALMRQEDNRVWVLDNAGERLMKIPGTERCAATFPEVEFKPESRVKTAIMEFFP